MRKITKEQAAFVLSKVNSIRHGHFHAHIGPHEFHLIATAIQSCIDNPFPSLEMDISCYDETRVVGKLLITKIEDRIEIEDTAERKRINLSKNEFLKMTEACQKVCDWIKSEKSSPC